MARVRYITFWILRKVFQNSGLNLTTIFTLPLQFTDAVLAYVVQIFMQVTTPFCYYFVAAMDYGHTKAKSPNFLRSKFKSKTQS